MGEGLGVVAEVAARGGLELLGVQTERRAVGEQALTEVLSLAVLADFATARRPSRRSRSGTCPRCRVGRRRFHPGGSGARALPRSAHLGSPSRWRRRARPRAAGSAPAAPAASRRPVRRVVVLAKTPRSLTPRSSSSLRISSASACQVSASSAWPAPFGQPRAAVHRHPAHQLRGHVVAGLAAGLPDALVGLAPGLRGTADLVDEHRPQPLRDVVALLGVHVDRVEHGAEDVVLALVEGAVADPHRAAPPRSRRDGRASTPSDRRGRRSRT